LLEWTSVEYFQVGIESLDRDNVAIIAKFEPLRKSSPTTFCVATTHLLFNPRRHDVKLAQTALLLAGNNPLEIY
jgi:protein angel